MIKIALIARLVSVIVAVIGCSTSQEARAPMTDPHEVSIPPELIDEVSIPTELTVATLTCSPDVCATSRDCCGYPRARCTVHGCVAF